MNQHLEEILQARPGPFPRWAWEQVYPEVAVETVWEFHTLKVMHFD